MRVAILREAEYALHSDAPFLAVRLPLVAELMTLTMQANRRSVAQRQAVVCLDVGGKLYKISRQLLGRYPQSRLAKMVMEFPELVEHGDALFVDRHPKMFEWILEIYKRAQTPFKPSQSDSSRDGDYSSCLPVGSKELLEKELDFYQLPSMEDLGLATAPAIQAFSKALAKKRLFHQILEEIEVSVLKGMFSWDIYIYYVLKAAKAEQERQVCVCVPRGTQALSAYFSQSSRSDFFEAIQCSTRVPEEISGQLIFPSSKARTRYVLPQSVEGAVQLLREPGREYGMLVRQTAYNQPTSKGYGVTIPCMSLRYSE